jgi:hypothetical protein
MFHEAFRDLATELLMMQALGDYEAAQGLMERYGSVPEAMLAAIDSLSDVPVDVDPVFDLGGLS